MTEISKVTFTLTLDTVMTNKLLKSMKHAGFSRVPVVEGDSKVVGILLAKSCLGVDLDEEKTLRQLSRER